MLILSVNTVFWCTLIYVLGGIRVLMPSKRLRLLVGNPLEKTVDGWTSINRLMFRVLGLTRIEHMEEPLQSVRKGWHVVVSNHQSWSDILVLQMELRYLSPPIKFFTKKELIWTPFVGPAMWILGFPYVHRAKAGEQALTKELHATNKRAMAKVSRRFLDRPVSVLSFLEGTRFTLKKQEVLGSPFSHLLAPKVGGLAFTLNELASVQPRILDVTIVYDGVVPGFWDLLCGRCRKIRMDIAEIYFDDLDLENLEEWANERWKVKDQRITTLST